MTTTPPLLGGTQVSLEVGGVGQTYWAFADVARCPNDDLLAVYYGAGSHVGPAGNLYSRRSTDDGASFGSRVTVRDISSDCRDPAITTLRDGRMALTFTETDNDSFLGNGTFYQATWMPSSDNGATWGAAIVIPAGAGLAWNFCTSKIVETPNPDELLLAYYGSGTINGGDDECRLAESVDGGATWADRSVICAEAGKDLDEPYLVLLADRRTLACFIRNSTDNQIEVATSTDWGGTWSARSVVTAGNGRPAAGVTNDGLVLVQFRDGGSNSFHYLALDRAADPASAGAEVNLAAGSGATMTYGGWAQRTSDGRLCAAFGIENSANVYFQVIDTVDDPAQLRVPPAELVHRAGGGRNRPLQLGARGL